VRADDLSAGGESTPSAGGLRRRLASNRIWIYAIPFFCILGITAAIYYFLILDQTTGSSGIAPLTNLLLLADEDLRYPLEAPDVAHESGALGRFERRYGVRVRVEYGAPTELYKQLQDGWRGDLYLTGDGASMNRARETGLVAEERSIARRVPVILARQGNPHAIENLSDLTSPNLRLGVAGEQSGMLGRVSADLLGRHGGTAAVASFTGSSSIELARAVEQDRVDAAIVWRNVGARYSRSTEMIDIRGVENEMGAVQVAVLATSRNQRAAAQLVRFFSGSASHEIFEMYGFDVGMNEADNSGGRR
jgi:molybdenum ABC transporter molybdate-binding protein